MMLLLAALACCSPLKPSQAALLATSELALTVDWRLSHNGAERHFGETNILLGPRPSVGAVDRYCIATILANTALTLLLPEKARNPWNLLLTGFETAVVWHQFRIGLRL